MGKRPQIAPNRAVAEELTASQSFAGRNPTKQQLGPADAASGAVTPVCAELGGTP